MTDQEKLIENRIWKLLAESIQDEEGGTTIPVPVEDIRRLIDAREKAHTPTDDEREAQGWREAALYAENAESQDDFMTGWRTADRLRRSEVPEPSIEPTCEHGSPLSELCEFVARYASGETDDAEPVHAPPQGEPSDARVLAALNASHGDIVPATDLRAFGTSKVDKMRAALRAAGVGGVR